MRISNSRVNSYGFRLLTSGADIEQYKRNPILLFNHSRPYRDTTDEVLPIGTVNNIRVDGDDIIGELSFDDKDEFARKIAQKWDDGIYRMVSVGATIIETSNDPAVLLPGQTRETITRWRLDEVSVVDIGANEDALALRYQDGRYVMLSNNHQADIVPKLKSDTIMKNVAMKLGLSQDAAEVDILQSIESLHTELAQLKNEAETLRQQAVELVVDKAIDDKRIMPAHKNRFLELGKKVGVDELRTVIDAIEPAVKPMDILLNGKSSKSELKAWNDYTSEELVSLRQNNPEAYAQLYRKEFGIELNY